jgi:succinoglycan biosynthesis protein ExoV
MQLFYYRDKFNFGDALNPWLWSKLLPGVLDQDASTAFVGIGTLLNEWLPYHTPQAGRRAIFSTGVGYGDGLPRIDDSYRIYCLRGPLSAKALGVAPELAVTDGAILLRRHYSPASEKSCRFAYMPHWQQADEDWDLVCQELGWSYIDPRWSIEKILASISQTEVLLAEAMHGVIIADALRVPWIPIVTHPDILSFKWHDWCQSIAVEYTPQYIQPLVNVSMSQNLASQWVVHKQAVDRFQAIASSTKPQLSNDRKIEDLTVELEARLEQFKSDVRAGVYQPIVVPVRQPAPDDLIVDLTQFYPQSTAPRDFTDPQLDLATMETIATQLLATDDEIKEGKFDRTIAALSWVQWQQIKRSIVANYQLEQDRLQAELTATQSQLVITQQQLVITQQQLATTQQQSIDLQAVITSMERTKFWRLRQRLIKFRCRLKLFIGGKP